MPVRLLREILVTPLPTQCDFVPSDLRLALFWLGCLLWWLLLLKKNAWYCPASVLCILACILLKEFMPRMTCTSYVHLTVGSVQFSSVAQSCPTLCDSMDCSMPGFLVHHQLLELAQTHIHWVGLDNHDGVITHPEPGILECEVKWALGGITINKASGGDGIPAELFQILEDDAVQVLHMQWFWSPEK